MKAIDTLEAQFRAELVSALRRAASGRGSTLFSLNDSRPRSTGRRLRQKAERIMELRQTYSVDRAVPSPAASYLAACLKCEHGGRPVPQMAKALLAELDRHAT